MVKKCPGVALYFVPQHSLRARETGGRRVWPGRSTIITFSGVSCLLFSRQGSYTWISSSAPSLLPDWTGLCNDLYFQSQCSMFPYSDVPHSALHHVHYNRKLENSFSLLNFHIFGPSRELCS